MARPRDVQRYRAHHGEGTEHASQSRLLEPGLRGCVGVHQESMWDKNIADRGSGQRVKEYSGGGTRFSILSAHLLRACVLSHFSHVHLFEMLWTTFHQAPLSMGFSSQEQRSGLLCPPPGDLPDSGVELESLLAPALVGRLFTTSATWEAHPPLIHTPEGYCSLRLLWGIQQMAVLAV